jgi:hypothetical protein
MTTNSNFIVDAIKKVPILGNRARRIYRWAKTGVTGPATFAGSMAYWQERYAQGGNSGVGSHGKFAEFKAEVLNQFVAGRDLRTVIEFGCGDGSQLALAKYPAFTGFDVSETAIDLCKRRFAADSTKKFKLLGEYAGETADLTLSLDVLYHLVEDGMFDSHMRMLFSASNRYVAIYSRDSNDNSPMEANHVRHRKFTEGIEANFPDQKLLCHIPNRFPYRGDYKVGSWSEFFIYERTSRWSCATSPETLGRTCLK